MRSLPFVRVLVGCGVSGAVAGNVISEHSGYYQEDVHYTIVAVGNGDRGVRIRKDSVWAQIWEFEAYDSETGQPGDIKYISIQPTGTVGYIRLRIVGDVGHQYGAGDVKRIDLHTNVDNTTEVLSINISGDCGEDGARVQVDDVEYTGSTPDQHI